MNAQTPDELMADYCYTSSSETQTTSDTPYEIDLAPQEQYDFGDWATTKFSSYLEFTITNSGYADVTISRVDLAGEFMLLEPIPNKIAAGAVYTGKLYFAPETVGSKTGMLSVEAENALGDKVIKLLGTAWDFLDLDIKGIVNEAGITLNDFPLWEAQLDVIVNTDLPVALV
ncbi:hypothetical protein HYP99_gp083 [Sinorhizobium phage ort11]|uniref:Uncharacterized protein n=1 Tax=Sinorhizobium phage ort11 TaxID=2599764 RepID=A0A5C2H7C3_9CAUD|nr:hypothetical protein HYP99_gp083 [Sinorhizobium phage ort11]QEP29881.1 hypothetical protein Smphiort11_083 [Sinorhizobium phage ort11]